MFHVEHSNRTQMNTQIQGMLVDIHSQEIYPAKIFIENGLVKSIRRIENAERRFILPGFVDAHVHIESSLLVPENFSRVAVAHGTVATVSDPHEIANVCGIEGVEFMMKNGEGSDLKFFWTAPSCVPSTSFETSGAVLGVDAIDTILKKKSIVALGEMMNYPGVIYNDNEVLQKIESAHRQNKPVDGHIPGITGADLKKYVEAGISTDHECATLEEALEKISLGMKILIREGSSAKNFESLYSLIETHPDYVMLCSDDLHADDLMNGHINLLVKRALQSGISIFKILRVVSLNPVQHYNLPVGLLQEGDSADFLIVDNLDDLNVQQTWINGRVVFDSGVNNGHDEISDLTPVFVNNFNSSMVTADGLGFNRTSSKANIILVEEGSILTGSEIIEGGFDEPFLTSNELLMLFVKDRYNDSPPANAFVKGFGPLRGAIASTIAHDSHNIIALGNNSADISGAINALVAQKGGIAFVSGEVMEVLPLPVGGLMSDKNALFVAERYEKIVKLTHEYGCVLKSPLMTLSFLALPVIPSLKLTDKGLFDVNKFEFTDLFVQ